MKYYNDFGARTEIRPVYPHSEFNFHRWELEHTLLSFRF